MAMPAHSEPGTLLRLLAQRIVVIDGAMGTLIQAQRLGEKAARVGFDWTSAVEVFKKVEEEMHELAATLPTQNVAQQEHELGDLLFALTSLARHLSLDSETALRKAGKRFSDRFRYIETQLAQNGEDIHDTSPARLEELWQEAKQALGEHLG